MESERINILLNNTSDATQDDILLLENELVKYPYAQFLHILLAKIQFELKSEDKVNKLTMAALYSSERSILKKVIQEKGYMDMNERITPFQELPIFELEEVDEESDSDINTAIEETESASIFDEVLKNLEKLKALRQQFQFLELNETESESEELPEKEKKPKKKIKKADPVKPKLKASENKKSTTSATKQKKIEEILVKDEILDSQVNVFFLKEIEKKAEPVESKNEDKFTTQNQIIEKFIEEQPSIGAINKEELKSSDEINKDLSVKSTQFGDDLVSENLAIILLKQGKKERAIDIYKKLIWKLPQKKAYFAARIEEIKK